MGSTRACCLALCAWAAFFVACRALRAIPRGCVRVMTARGVPPRPTSTLGAAAQDAASASAESRLLELVSTLSGRGAGLSAPEALPLKLEIESLISQLEAAGLVQTRDEAKLEGCWKLLYTSTPGNTQSPIQRSLTSLDGVSIFQVINLNEENSFLGEGRPDVSNTVVFGDALGRLRITALASTSRRKLVEPRVGDGTIFGLSPFGKSFSAPPRLAEERIDFKFEEAVFEFVAPLRFSVPYPVPFKLLGDEAKGFIDNTYFSSQFRIARGNKGTVFLLQKANVATDKKAALAAAASLTVVSPPAAKAPTTVGILFPSQLGTRHDYADFKASVESELGLKLFITPLERLDWPLGLIGTFFSKEFLDGKLLPAKTLAFYFNKVDEAVADALAANPDAEIAIISHSIGGWVARSWLSEWASPEVKRRCKVLVSLGSPHNPPPSDSPAAKVDQTRGLLTYINEKHPGAFEASVQYISVIGRSVSGELNPASGEQLLAFGSYSALCGDGQSVGDGIIPVSTASLQGAINIVIDDAKHSNFIPTPFKEAIFLPDAVWYGTKSVVQKWAPEVKRALGKGKK